MKFFKKVFYLFTIFLLTVINFASFASNSSGVSNNEYIFFYWDWCPHCAEVEDYFNKNNIFQKYKIQTKEVYHHSKNREQMLNLAKKLNIDLSQLWVPFLVIDNNGKFSYLIWDKDIINYFKNKQSNNTSSQNLCGINEWNCTNNNSSLLTNNYVNNWLLTQNSSSSWTNVSNNSVNSMSDWKFFLIMLPAALSDSINPCAFAVMLILLASILQTKKRRKDVILSWCLFILAVFISYYLMWLGILKVLASVSTTNILKWIVGLLWIFVGLANLKDAFWYGKFFVMEVPFSWRPKLKKIISSVTSPIWAFFVGLIVSLFLLPCTSWPYLTILWFFTQQGIQYIKWLVYLFIYNVIFVLPMVGITILVAYWKSVEKLMQLKDKNNKYIHLIVWLLMLWLGIYVLIS